MSRYSEAHRNYKGPGDARPTAMQIVEDENLVNKLNDKVFLITGKKLLGTVPIHGRLATLLCGLPGIGIETMRALYATGGHVFGTVRNISKGQKAVDDVKSRTKSDGKITLIEMDQESLASVRAAAESFLKQSKSLNILINNAGVMATPEGKTKDGFETQFGVNHFSPEFPSRVVSVSSFGHRYGGMRFDDYNFTRKDSYDPNLSYGQSKTANVWLANEIERRYASQNLHSTSLHPGGIVTGLQIHVAEMMKAATANPDVVAYMKNTEQGASTSVYAALSEEWKDKGGKYLSDCVEQPQWSHPDEPMYIGDDGHAVWAYDVEGAKKLWKDSCGMVGVEDDA